MTVRSILVFYTMRLPLTLGLMMAGFILEFLIELPFRARVVRTNLHMLYNEVMLADRLAQADVWAAVKRSVNDAVVMANSGVIHEVTHHLTRAVSQVTTVSQRCMTLLREEGLL